MSYLFVFLIVSLLIFAHELGHFWAARMLGIPVTRVSLGIGRPLWRLQRGGTEYRLSMVPLGGYVLPDQKSYFAQSPGARMLFAFGGPAANLAVTFVLMGVFNVWMYGASFEAVLSEPYRQTGEAVRLVARALPAVLFGSGDAVGPLGVLAEGGAFVGSSLLLALQFAAVMSVNLAILNLVPVPPLDGGRILLCALEIASNRAARLHVPLNVAGFLALVGFLSWVTALDLKRLLTRLFA